MNRLEGKVTIVTGAARGLGRAIALKLAEDEAILLIVTRRNIQGLEEAKKLLQARGAQVTCAKVDVSVE